MMRLNIKKLREEKNTTIISSEEALKNVNPFNWSNDVINGNKKVEIKLVDN